MSSPTLPSSAPSANGSEPVLGEELPGEELPGGDEPGGEWPGRSARLGPALVVLAIAVALVGGGAALALVGTGHRPLSAPARGRLPGVALPALAAGPLLDRVESGGEPPTDVRDALVVPAGASFVSAQRSGGLQLYSASVTLTVPATPGKVVAFYRAELAHLGWGSVTIDAPATGPGSEVLARHPSSDGFYWGVGAVVRPVTPSLSPALAGGDQHAVTSTL